MEDITGTMQNPFENIAQNLICVCELVVQNKKKLCNMLQKAHKQYTVLAMHIADLFKSRKKIVRREITSARGRKDLGCVTNVFFKVKDY